MLRKTGGERLWNRLMISCFKVTVTYSLQVSELLMVRTFREWRISCHFFRPIAYINAFSLHMRKLSALGVFICHFPLLPSHIRSKTVFDYTETWTKYGYKWAVLKNRKSLTVLIERLELKNHVRSCIRTNGVHCRSRKGEACPAVCSWGSISSKRLRLRVLSV
jgi:hypothetical protein